MSGAVGSSPFWALCRACDHRWPAAYLPFEMESVAKRLSKVGCPRCGTWQSPLVPKQSNGTLQEPDGYPALPWLPMSSAPRKGHVILCMQDECIPDLPYVRTGGFISRDQAVEIDGDAAGCGPDGGWFIWDTNAESWHIVGLAEPRGWLPLPELATRARA